MKVCFFDSGKDCSALNVKKCKGCKFFKTEKQYYDDLKRSEERLKRIGWNNNK